MTEKRRSPRVAQSLLVSLRFDSLDHAVETRTVNISKHGVFLEMKRPRPVGTLVQFRVSVEYPSRFFDLQGTVARAIEPGTDGVASGIGVDLENRPPEWDEFVDELAGRLLNNLLG